jgi:2-phosphosulfolactate phosphatase
VAELCEPAREVAIAALVNVTATARWVARRRSPVLVVCAGHQGDFSMEDAVCAGLLLRRALDFAPALPIDHDAARASLALADQFGKDPAAMLARSEHGRYLLSRGYGDDLAVAAQVDALKTVPILREGRITTPDGKASGPGH